MTAILKQFASFLKNIGAQLIEFGVMVVAFKSALKSVLANPWVAIGVGAAMVAAAALMTALIPKGDVHILRSACVREHLLEPTEWGNDLRIHSGIGVVSDHCVGLSVCQTASGQSRNLRLRILVDECCHKGSGRDHRSTHSDGHPRIS